MTSISNQIYLDNSATTPLCEEAEKALNEAVKCYANPSSLHALGYASHNMLEAARDKAARALGLRSGYKREQIIFTSSGTEASNLAILGALSAKERKNGKRILSTDCEHPSVDNVLGRLEAEGYDVVRIPTHGGVLDMDALENALDAPVVLATFMMVNNETGARFDVEKAFAMVKEKYPDAITHCDMVQGFLKDRTNAVNIGADMVTVSGHKIHAPKGSAALYVSANVLTRRNLVPIVYGGGQEGGFRSGTENMLGIVAFGAAAEAGDKTKLADIEKMNALRHTAISKINEMGVSGLRVNEPVGACAPHIISLTLPSIKSETMLHYLSGRGIYVSSGSACSSHSKKASSSLIAFGLTPAEADCTIRISLSRYNTEEDIDELCTALSDGTRMLVKIRR